MNRRAFFSTLIGAMTLDPERALWVPGKKLISIPKTSVRARPYSYVIWTDVIANPSSKGVSDVQIYSAQFANRLSGGTRIELPHSPYKEGDIMQEILRSVSATARTRGSSPLATLQDS